MENRCRILDAAARVYALLGFRGATTRRIAEAAGVNEVTLFRLFGSKEALIGEALRTRATTSSAALALPADPVDPEHELTTWATAHLAELRESRALIRQAMSDLEERPDAAPCVAAGWSAADHELRRYLVRLGETGFVDWARVAAAPSDAPARPAPAVAGPVPNRYEDASAAGAMLMAALFSDAMGRDMMPELFPQPAERAPVLYVRLFLRAVECRQRRARPRARRRAS